MTPFYSRKSPRAQRYDYHAGAIYFVTICTKNRKHYFGEIRRTDYRTPQADVPTYRNQMILSDIGNICDEQLQIMIKKRPRIDMHEYITMPNHVHLLFWMGECSRDTGLPCPENENDYKTPQADVPTTNIINQTLGSVIGGRKSAVSKKCGELGLSFARQSRYHDHIVRNEKEYEQIKYYIQTNPDKRGEDKHYTDA